MARGIFYGLPVPGHMHPGLGLVRELVRRGHQVEMVATPAWSDRIAAVGGVPRLYQSQLLASLEPPANSLVMLSLALRIAQDVLPQLVRDVEDAAPGEQPDFLIIDSAAPWGVIVARRSGLPSVTSSTTFAINPPVANAINGGPRRFIPMLLRGGGALVDAMRRRHALRREWGVEPPRLPEIVGAPAQATVAYTSRSFQPLAHTFGPDTHFVGPVLDARDETWADPLEPGFLYVSLGTLYHHNAGFFRLVIEATRDLDVPVLLNVGRTLDPASFRDAPSHVRIVQSVPQLAVLEQAGAFVTHGGMNSVHEALLAGVPMVVVPQAVDQFLVGERVADVGAGIDLDSRRLDVDGLRRAIRAVRSDPSYAQAAAAMGADLRAAGGVRRAADVVEAVVEQAVEAAVEAGAAGSQRPVRAQVH